MIENKCCIVVTCITWPVYCTAIGRSFGDVIRNIYTIWYSFYTVLYQFLETGTSVRCLICIVQNLRFSGFRLYHLSFFLYSPFKFLYHYIVRFCMNVGFRDKFKGYWNMMVFAWFRTLFEVIKIYIDYRPKQGLSAWIISKLISSSIHLSTDQSPHKHQWLYPRHTFNISVTSKPIFLLRRVHCK